MDSEQQLLHICSGLSIFIGFFF